MLVDHQKRLQRAAEIAIAARHDLVDRGFFRSERHRYLLLSLRTKFRQLQPVPVKDVDKGWATISLSHVHPAPRKNADHGYKMADDARMTGIRICTGNSTFLPRNHVAAAS